MKTNFSRCSMLIVAFLSLLIVGYAANAKAQVPTKTITIYNNSKTDTIYPVLAAYIGNADLWLQAQFKISPSDSYTRPFCNNDSAPGGVKDCAARNKKPPLFRAYINFNKGVLPQQSVSVVVPFYTQLVKTDSSTLGKSSPSISIGGMLRASFSMTAKRP